MITTIKHSNNNSNNKSNKVGMCILDKLHLFCITTLMSNIWKVKIWVYLNHLSVIGSLWLITLHIIKSNSRGLLLVTMLILVMRKVISGTQVEVMSGTQVEVISGTQEHMGLINVNHSLLIIYMIKTTSYKRHKKQEI